jgi:UDP-N-acetylmuramate dehydrogenase
VGGSASHFVKVTEEREIRDAILYAQEHELRVVILGGGSNVLVPDRGIDALVIVPAFMTVTYTGIDDHTVIVSAGAGVELDALIRETVEKGLWGLENLSAIPGSVGGVPVQNVGAYGVEAKDVVQSVTVYDRETKSLVVLTNEECTFAYRTSLFKREEGKRYIITHVAFELSRVPHPKIVYKDLAVRFSESREVTQNEIRNALIDIRSNKFPDWHTQGTAGSFFKNPILDKKKFLTLKEQYPDMVGFIQNGKVKVSLGWILDHVLHLKGYREGNVGLYEAQALVLVTHGESTSEEILSFSESIIQKIFDATGIVVEREVVLL